MAPLYVECSSPLHAVVHLTLCGAAQVSVAHSSFSNNTASLVDGWGAVNLADNAQVRPPHEHTTAAYGQHLAPPCMHMQERAAVFHQVMCSA